METTKKDLNIIYYGSAGTGKTYIAIEKAKEYIKTNFKGKEELEKEIIELQKKFEKATGRAATKYGEQLDKKIKEKDKFPTEEEFIFFTTFHPSYQYQEFIEGINIKEQDGNVVYEIKDGIFKIIAKRASENRDKNYVLIIDEINRGNISAIFGELFTLLETTKRSYKDSQNDDEQNLEAVSIALPYSGEKFSVPSNLYIIGTMNTTVKSISLLDVALRRRFKFIEVLPNYDLVAKIDGVDLPQMLKTINERLSVLKGVEFQIGHSYFMEKDISGIEDLREVFKYKMLPLLKEYFHNDWEIICAVLGQDYETPEDNKLLKLLIKNEESFKRSANKFNSSKKFKKIFQLKEEFDIQDLQSIYN